MGKIEELKRNINFVSVVESAGVELTQRGSRHVALCPFHTEKTPSFYIFQNSRFKCFGCSERGDAIDFVQKIYGLSFKDALKHLGIEQGKITPAIRRDVEKRKRKAEAVKKFRQWEIHYCIHVSDLFFRTKKLMNGISPADLKYYAMLFHQLPIWEYHIYILIHGDDEAKFKLFEEAQQCRKKNLI